MTTDAAENRRLRAVLAGLLPLAVAMAVGAGLATLPHWWTGEATWVADYDELVNLPMGARAYREHPWRLADPVTGGPTYYQPLSTVPGVLLAKALGLEPLHLGLCWRALGGLAVGAAWYLLLRVRFRPWPALAAACVLLADPGVLEGQLGYALAKKCARPLPVENPSALPNLEGLPQWRILSPALTWPWYLAFFALTARAVAVPSRGRVLAAGVACGLLFYLYFYLWTAAIAGLVFATVLDRRRWTVYLGVLAVGVAVGLPALIESARFRAEHGSDWLLRTDKFVPVGRFSELLIPRASVVLLAVVWTWVWWRCRERAWLAATATAALLLMNHTVITKLQIENFHWKYALGPPLSLLTVLLVADLFARLPPRIARFGPALAGVLAVTTVIAGGWVYARASTGLQENRRIRETVAAFEAQRVGLTLPGGGAVAGEPEFQYLAAVAFDLRPLAGYSALISPISDAGLDTRIALNGYLLGWSRERFAADQDAELRRSHWGPEARSEEARSARLASRLAAWDAVARDPAAAVNRFGVRVLARPSGGAEPAPAGWVLVQRGPRWDVWVRAGAGA
jgi:hypothetical protein